jgi:uncharacterized metal-binding protein (TIGR02443 family)
MSRRFIAGAVCPRCGKMDKLVVDGERDVRECVACGFLEQRPLEGVAEIKTRVTRGASRRVETEAEKVRLLDPGGDGRED